METDFARVSVTRRHERIGQLRQRLDSLDAHIASQRELIEANKARGCHRDASLELLHDLVESKATYGALLKALEAPTAGRA